ncbi:MAG: hypothetical protein KAS75_00365 [Planctomycetes bacterium]|nr:hypothetical protein [Planctomycetota bacterium]
MSFLRERSKAKNILAVQVDMNYFIRHVILIGGVGDEESSFWMQMLVLLLALGFWGLYSLVKEGGGAHGGESYGVKGVGLFGRFREHIVNYKDAIGKRRAESRAVRKAVAEPVFGFDVGKVVWKNGGSKPASGKGKGLSGGMELLGLEFVVSVVEGTEGKDTNDVTMRKLNFSELLRREKLNRVNSKSLKVYAVNRDGVYGKKMQYEAMRELAGRTVGEGRI